MTSTSTVPFLKVEYNWIELIASGEPTVVLTHRGYKPVLPVRILPESNSIEHLYISARSLAEKLEPIRKRNDGLFRGIEFRVRKQDHDSYFLYQVEELNSLAEQPVEELALEVALPEPVGRDTRRQIREAFDAGLNEIDLDCEAFVNQKISSTIRNLRSQGGWLSSLAFAGEVLASVYFEETNQETRLSEPSYRWILASLMYLCNPFDVIPDFTPGRGYLDDAVVVNRCISQLRNRWTTVFDKVSETAHSLNTGAE